MSIKKKGFAIFLFLSLLFGSAFMNVGAASYQETGTEQETETIKKDAIAVSETTQKKQETEKESVQETEKKPDKKPDKKPEKETETETEETEAVKREHVGSAPEQPEKAGRGVELQTADDMRFAALIPDPNFRKVILKALEDYNWLEGDPNKPPQSVQEILETYTGPIDGDGQYKPDEEKIKSIEGIQYLKLATTGNRRYSINIQENLIEDITPITRVCSEQAYYGLAGASVKIHFLYNPIRCLPRPGDASIKYGYLSFQLLNDNGSIFGGNPEYYFLRDATESFSQIIRIGYCQYDTLAPDSEYVPIKKVDIIGNTENIVFEKTGDGPNQNENLDGKVSNLRKSGKVSMNVFPDWTITITGITPTGGETTSDTALSYNVPANVTIFDKVKIAGSTSGRAQLRKVDRDTGEPVNGGVYNFYKKQANGSDILLEENLVTASVEGKGPGYTKVIENLDPGTYYFQEVSAPPGYELDDQKIEVQIKQISAYISGGEKELDYTGSTGEKVQASSDDNETYITRDMKEGVHLFLGEDPQQEYENAVENAAIKEVKVTYSSLDRKEKPDVFHYNTIQEAEDALNTYVRGNKITGSVKAEVIYDRDSNPVLKEVTSSEPPSYTKVHAKKNWVGVSGDEILPAVTFHLLRNAEGSKEETEINSYTVPEGTPKEDYFYTFETDRDGNKLRQYGLDSSGNTFKYEYSILEECSSDEYVFGTPENPTELAFETTTENGKVEKTTTYSITVSNYKKASIHIIKVDANDSSIKLSDVEFKLEKWTGEVWEKTDSKTTNESGEVFYEKLESGDYRVTETKTQAGYILLKEPILFTIGDLTDENSQRELEYTVENSKSYHLPSTGGVGKEWMLMTGLLGIMAACVLLIKKEQKNRR